MRDRLKALTLLLVAMVRAEPVRTIGAIVVVAGGRLAGLGTAIGLKLLIDAMASGGSSARLDRAVLVLAGAVGLGLLAKYPIATVGVSLRERAAMALEGNLIRLSTGLPGIEHFERPEYLDKMQQLRQVNFELGEAVASIVDNVAAFALLISSAVVLGAVHPALLILPLSALPTFAAAAAKARLRLRFEERMAAEWRAKKGLREIAWDPKWGPELRLFGAGDTVLRRQIEAANTIGRAMVGFVTRAGLIQSAGDLSLKAGQVAAVAFVALRVRAGDLPAGDVLLTAALASQVGRQATEAIEGVTWLIRLLAIVGRLQWLTDEARKNRTMADGAATTMAASPAALTTGIDVRGLTFSYPGTAVAVLEGVDLHIPAGSTLALVGENGAGKTTLVKLLCRLYQPTAGHIEIDGIDLATIDVDAWRGRVTAVFQDFARLELLARETVGVGDVEHINDEQRVAVAVASANAGAVVADLPTGLSTQLGRRFADGAELSGGQWQKMALARAAMRDEPLLFVLDEPTAALDPQAEHDLFERVGEASRSTTVGAITVFVSHRFSTVRMADRIAVIEHGGIAELGTHEELMARNGRYAALYNRQARGYR